MSEVVSPTRREAVAVSASFLVLALVATWPLARNLGRALPGDLGDPLLNAWTLGWIADRMRHGLVGLWQAPIFFPARDTLAFSESLLGIGVFVAPIVWATGNPILGYNVAFVLSYVLAGVGMYLLARELTGRRDAAMIAGAVFAFAPARGIYISHLQVLASGWMPIALWGLHRYFATRSVSALVTFVIAFVVNAWTNAYFLYFLTILVAIVALWEVGARRAWQSIDRRLLRQLLAALFAILLLIAWMIATYATVRRLYGLHRGLGDWRMFSADLSSYVSVADNVPFWRRWLTADSGPERQLFPGATALLLAAIALWRGRSNHGVKELYVAIGAIALTLSLGPEPRVWSHPLPVSGPFLWLARIVPGADGIRVPARLGVVVLLAVSVLAAIGFSWLAAWRPRAQPWLLAAALAIVFVEGWPLPMHLAAFDYQGRREDRPLYRWLAAEPPGAVLELPVHEWSIAPTLTYQFATLSHRHPLVNGYSGYGAALQAFVGSADSPLRELDRMSAALEMLRSIGVRYVIVHPHDYDDVGAGIATAAAIRASTGDVEAEQPFEDATGFRLRTAAALSSVRRGGAPLNARGFTITASDNQDRVALAVDGNPATRWLNGRSQDGTEWLKLELDRAYDITRIVLTMEGRTAGDYPRVLRIESANGAQSTVLYDGHVLIPYGESIARGSGVPEIALDLPVNVTRTLVIRQTVSSRRWWSIHELRVWGRDLERVH